MKIVLLLLSMTYSLLATNLNSLLLKYSNAGNFEKVKIILEKGANPNMLVGNSTTTGTLTTRLVMQKKFKMAELLMEYGGKITRQKRGTFNKRRHNLAIDALAEYSRRNNNKCDDPLIVLKYLATQGINLSKAYASNELLQQALYRCDKLSFFIFQNGGNKILTKMKDNGYMRYESPLSYILFKNKIDLLKQMVDTGVKIDFNKVIYIDNRYKTEKYNSLRIAAKEDNLKLFKYLLNNGAIITDEIKKSAGDKVGEYILLELEK